MALLNSALPVAWILVRALSIQDIDIASTKQKSKDLSSTIAHGQTFQVQCHCLIAWR